MNAQPCVLLGAGLAVLSACAHGPAAWPPPVDMGLPPDRAPGADAVHLSRTAELRFLDHSDPSAGYELTVHELVQVLTPGGRALGRVLIPLDYWTRLESIAGRSYLAQSVGAAMSSQLVADGKDVAFFPVVVEGGAHYSDNRIAIFDVPGAHVGRVVEVRYKVRSRQSFALAPWTFDGAIPTRRSRLTVLEPAGWKLIWGYSGGDRSGSLAPVIAPAEGGRWLTWEQRDLPAVEEEPYGLPPAQLLRTLQLAVAEAPSGRGVYGDWSAVGRFYRSLTAGLGGVTGEVDRDLAQHLAAHPNGDEADAIYRFVRNRIRYVAIREGIGALKPHPASAVYAARFGDCKDMVTLLLALYAKRGITAFPALVSTRSHGPFHADVPTTSAFDHVIVAIPREGSYRFTDPTARNHAFSMLPWEVQGQQALVVIDDGRSEIVKLPIAAAEANRHEVTWHVRGDVATLGIRLEGEAVIPWRPLQRAEDARRRLIRALETSYASDLDGAAVDDAGWAEVPASDDALTIRATVRVPRATVALGDRRFIGFGQFFGVAPEVRVPAERLSPVELGPPGVWVHRLIVDVPADARIERVPPPVRVRTAGGRYELRVETGPGRVEITRVMDRQAHRIAPNELGELRRFNEAYASHGRDAVVLAPVNLP